jgi:hypothetical protein
MPAVVSDAAVPAGRTLRLPNGGEYVRRVYIGPLEKPPTPDPYQPQMYSVAQMPDTVVEPHYHAVEQWQVFVDGSGTLGRHSALPGALHYVDRFTGYGPIAAGSQGVTYFTIRAMTDPGAQFLDKPDARKTLKEAAALTRRYLYVAAERVAPDVATAPPGGVSMDALIAPHADGLAAWAARAGPDAEFHTPEAVGTGGQAILVLDGGLVNDGNALPRLSCAFVGHDDAPLRFVAAPTGAVVLILQFPRAP